MRTLSLMRVASFALVLMSLGCKGHGPTEYSIESPPEVSEAARAMADRFYRENCAQCHGNHGDGDGPQEVHPRPQRLTDRVWQANVTNVRLRKVILHGGNAVNKSPKMPANPQLAQQPEVLDGLVALIRSFAALKSAPVSPPP